MKKGIKALCVECQSIWSQVHSEWTLSKLEEIYLLQALQSLDSAMGAEAKAKEEGLSLEDKTGRKYLNPLLTQAKISRNNYLRLLKLVGFEKALKEKVKRRVGHPTTSETYGVNYAENQK